MKKIISILLILLLSSKVYAYDANGYKTKVNELKDLLSVCIDSGLECPYEEMQITVMEQFLDPTDLSNPDYVSARMDEIYEDTKAKLQSYINKEAIPMQTPKYKTSRTKIDGSSMIADTTWGERPVFFMGYGHFQQAADAFPIFSKIGANITQQVIYPWNVISVDTNSDKFVGWSERYSNESSGNCSILNNYDTDYAMDTSSIKMELKSDDEYGYFYQSYPVEANTTYRYSIDVYADTDDCMYFKPASNVSKQYTKKSDGFVTYSGTFVTGNVSKRNFEIMIDQIGTCYIDNISVVKEGTDVNLITNGDFETYNKNAFGDKNQYIINTDYIDNTIIPMLESAEENNVSVSLLLACHVALPKHTLLYSDINVFHDQHILVMEKYIETVMNKVKGYKSLDSVLTSNEMSTNTATISGLLPDYQNWLKECYNGDIATLNAAYSSDYNDFEQIPFPEEATVPAEGTTRPTGSQTRYFYDWMIYNNKKLADWNAHMGETIKKYMPEAKVHSKIQDYFDVDSSIEFARYRLTWGTEAEDFAKFSDFHGNDSVTYYSWDGRHIQGQMKWYDYMASTKDMPIFNSEDHIVEDNSSYYNSNMARFTRADMIQGAIHGRTATAIWAWERSNDPNSIYYGNLMQRPDFMVAIGKSSFDLNRLAYEITALNKADAKLAILYSNLERVYAPNYLTVVDQVYKAGLYSGQKVRFVTDNDIDKVNNFEVLIVPGVKHITDANLEKIIEFKNNGGKVILLGECFKYNEYGNPIEFNSDGYIKGNKPNWEGDYTDWSDMFYDVCADDTVRICNSDGEIQDRVEWSYTRYNGKILVNVCNYTNNDISNMKMYYKGELVEPTDLISDKKLGVSFTAKSYEPMILVYEPVSFVKEALYENGIAKINLYNPTNSEVYVDINVEAYKNGRIRHGGRFGGKVKVDGTVNFEFDCPENDIDKVVAKIQPQYANADETVVLWKR